MDLGLFLVRITVLLRLASAWFSSLNISFPASDIFSRVALSSIRVGFEVVGSDSKMSLQVL